MTAKPAGVGATAVASRLAGIPAITEREFQRQVTDLAELFGWQWAHFRPAQTARGWRTPVSGPLGAGFPDLVLARPKDGRLIFAELKRDGAKTTPDQDRVLELLEQVAGPERGSRNFDPAVRPQVEVFIWRPADLEQVMAVLRG